MFMFPLSFDRAQLAADAPGTHSASAKAGVTRQADGLEGGPNGLEAKGKGTWITHSVAGSSPAQPLEYNKERCIKRRIP